MASKLLSVAARMLVDVTPILAIVGAKRMTVRERPFDVAVLRETELTRWLLQHPVTLTPEQVRHIAGVAAQPAAWKRMPEVDAVDHSAFDQLRVAIDRARRRRRTWIGVTIAAIPIGFVVIWSALMDALLAR